MSISYDEEAIYQDADIEMAEWTRAGNRVAQFRKANGCACQGVRELKYGEQQCTDGCGRIFADEAAWLAHIVSVQS